MSTSFRLDLARRLVHIAALAAPVAASSSLSGCNLYGCGSDTPPDVEVCFDPGTVGAEVALDAGPTVNGCPTRDSDVAPDAILASASADSNLEVDNFSILGGPVIGGGRCCYVVQAERQCVGGRPFLVGDRAMVAPAQRGAGGWSDTEEPLPPDLRDLLAGLRARLVRG